MILSPILWSSSQGIPSRPDDSLSDDCDFIVVSRVIDGDTFIASDGEKVRLIGVDTPETVDTRRDVQWFGREASRKLREWIEDDMVCLRKETAGTGDRDRYGRLLRYVWKYGADSDSSVRMNGFFVNAEIIRQGYAFAYTRFPFRYMEEFRRHERTARERNLGLWNKEKLEAWQRDVRRNSAIALTCGQNDTICPEDANGHIGDRKTVRFFVKKSFDSGKAIFLNSENDHTLSHNFTAVIFSGDRGNFPGDPADHYWGKAVEVSGVIKKYKGRAEIIMEVESQIRVLN
jgi:micrococcal nuclease